MNHRFFILIFTTTRCLVKLVYQFYEIFGYVVDEFWFVTLAQESYYAVSCYTYWDSSLLHFEDIEKILTNLNENLNEPILMNSKLLFQQIYYKKRKGKLEINEQLFIYGFSRYPLSGTFSKPFLFFNSHIKRNNLKKGSLAEKILAPRACNRLLLWIS